MRLNRAAATFADHVVKVRRQREFTPEPLLVWRIAGHIVSVHQAAQTPELWLFSSEPSGWDSGPMDTRGALMVLGSDTWLIGGIEPAGSWVNVLEPQVTQCVAAGGIWLCAVPANVPIVKAQVNAPTGEDEVFEIEIPTT